MKFKRFLAFLLAVCMIVTLLPAKAQAAEENLPAVDNSTVTATGTNGFGALLSQEIMDYQAAMSTSEDPSGFSVSELTIQGSTATVRYTAWETATLVVAVYSEDGLQMLTSGKTTVHPDGTEATVTIEGEMPEYFLAGAYLLDVDSLEPLCREYKSDMYTQGMQELLNSTVEDYDPALVWNFDDDNTTNFGVFDAAVIRPVAVEGKNRVVTADYENRIFVIADADENFTRLKKGNVVWYAYGENEILVVKVDTVTVEGTNVAITGAPLEMEEIFSDLKIETRADASDAVVNTEQEADFVYDSTVQHAVPRSGDDVITDGNIGDPFSVSLKFTIADDSVSVEGGNGTKVEFGEDGFIVTPGEDVEIEIGGGDDKDDDNKDDEDKDDDNKDDDNKDDDNKDDDNKDDDNKDDDQDDGNSGPEFEFGIEGSVDIAMDLEFYYYIVDTTNWIARHSNVKLDIKMIHAFELTISAAVKKELSAPEFGIRVLGGVVNLSVKPAFVVGFEVKCTFKATIYPRIAFRHKSQGATKLLFWEYMEESVENLSEWWHAPGVCEPSIEGTFSIGVEFEAAVSLIDLGEAELLKIGLPASVTAKITAKQCGTRYEIPDPTTAPDNRHACERCYEIGISLELELSVEFELVEVVKLGLTLLNPEWQLADMYYSVTAKKEGKTPYGGFGECPYWEHRVTVEVKDSQGKTLDGVLVSLSNGETRMTNENGLAAFYVSRGDYTVSALVNGETLTRNIRCLEQSLKVTLNAVTSGRDTSGAKFDDLVTILDKESITSYPVVKSGRCGENVYYTIDSNGTLYIYGEGAMYDHGEKLYLSNFSNYTFTHIEILPGVTRIGDDAFMMCSRAVSVSIPDTVTSIGELAFWNCGLTEIHIPDSVVSMEVGVLAGCSKLTTVEIPESVTNFEGAMFWNCYDLESVKLPSHLTILPAETFWNCSSLTDVVIPDGVTAIGVKAFSGCIELQNLTIPGGVTWLGERAFQDCHKLEGMDIPGGVSYIGPYAFLGCHALTKLVIPEGVTEIGEYTFYACRSLETLVLPGTVQSIGDLAFYDCESLKTLDLPEGIPSLGWQAFAYCYSLEELEIPASVQSIGESAFTGCRSLKKINIPEGITTIGRMWFHNCISLTEVEIPSTVTAIADDAFYNCKSLVEIDLPQGLQTIGINAFAYCLELTDITLPQGVTGIGNSAFSNCKSLQYLELPDSVQYIGTYAFSSCESLVEMTIPQGITAINYHTFAGCTNLESVTIPDSVTVIDFSAFSYCKKLKSIAIPESVTAIGSSAFNDCDALTEVVLPSGLTVIEHTMFANCDLLERVSIPSGVTSIGNYAFSNCPVLTEVVIPESVTTLGTNVFWNCDALEEITLPSGLTVIANGLFSSCENLKRIVIPAGVTTIENNAFSGCESLTEITIPASVTKISYGILGYCDNLNRIVFEGDLPTISGDFLYDVEATAYYPAGNATWTESALQDYGGTITWVPYTLDANGIMTAEDTAAITVVPSGDEAPVEPEYFPAMEQPASPEPEVQEPVEESTSGLPSVFAADLHIPAQPDDNASPDAIFGGDTIGSITDGYTVYTATFTGLVPGAEYVMLVLVSLDAGDVLAADNLLGILQGTAEADGSLKFQYVQRVNTDVSYVVACGLSNKNLKDATITFPEMTADGTLQTVNPTVTYGGVTLTEGVDYEISGTVDFTAGGTYTCRIRGIGGYAGTVTCTYTVAEILVVLGDVNGDGEIDILDANLVVAWYNEVRELEDDQLLAADVNGDGEVDIMDANMIVAYYNEVIDAFPAKK